MEKRKLPAQPVQRLPAFPCSAVPARMIQDLEPTFFQHPHCDELLLNMPLQNLNQEFPQVSGLSLRPRVFRKTLHRGTKHLCRQSARFPRYFGRRQALVVGAHQAISQSVKIGAATIEAAAADGALCELGEEADEASQP